MCVYVRLYIYGGGLEKNVLHEVGGQEKWNMAYLILHQPPPLNNDRSLIAGCPQGESWLKWEMGMVSG